MTRQTLLAVAAALGAIGVASASDRQYDKQLAQAAARIAAERMGDLRGGFSSQGRAVFVEQQADARAHGANSAVEMRPGIWVDGLAIAVERRTGVSPEL